MARTRSARSGRPPRTGASACGSRTSSSSTTRCPSVRRFTSPSGRDPRLPPRSRSFVAGVGLVGVVGGIILLVFAVSLLGSFRSTAPGEVCVVQEGGPLDGRGVAKVRQPGEGVSNIGIFNKQRCFPATERNYII